MPALSTDFSSSSPTDMVHLYNSTLTSALDSLAPVRTRKASFLRSSPWFNDELRQMKAKGRQLERRWRKDGLTVHRLAFRDHQKDYADAMRAARAAHYSTIIADGVGNPRTLFSTIDLLLNPINSGPSTTTPELCNRFATFFKTKVDDIRAKITPSVRSLPICPYPTNGSTLSSFTEVAPAELLKILTKSRPTTCSLDPIPTPLLKSCSPTLVHFLTTLINKSLQSGEVPAPFKTAAVRPLLKKPNLDREVLSNFRPISNLPFLSKLLERVVVAQLHPHLSGNNLYEALQSGFRPAHSTETALVKVTNDLLRASDSHSPSILILLDLSAAFDTVDHQILLQRLETYALVKDAALSWFASYLANRCYYVSLDGARSDDIEITCGVPQGSVLGPILFLIYLLPLGHILRNHCMNFHFYADDGQIYIKTQPNPTDTVNSLNNCLKDIQAWMSNSFLQLNGSKTEAILIGTTHQCATAGTLPLSIIDQPIPLSPAVTNLGVIFDCSLSFQAHIKNICRISYFHLRNIARLKPSLSKDDLKTLVNALILSRIDYANALLYGLPAETIRCLQVVMNSCARMLTDTRRKDHITPVLAELH